MRKPPTWSAEPEAEPLFCPIISADDHLLEPATVFEGRVPSHLADAVPHVTYDDDGCPGWIIDGERVALSLVDGAVGRPIEEWTEEPARYDEMRQAVWDPVARTKDMDLSGVWASLCFSSITWGFAGWRFSKMRDPEIGLAAMRAYNDWMIDEWCGAAPDRFIPCQIGWLRDPELAAIEIRRNAERGFKAVSFSENPEPMGFPTIYSPSWDPFLRACEETGTVINLHVGSSGHAPWLSSDSSRDVAVALFPLSAISALTDWIYARVPIRFPELRISMSEGGASWVPMVTERLRRAYRQVDASDSWSSSDPDPVELVRRNFYFCSIEDPFAFRNLADIGEDRLMIETDYPHFDSSWPRAQEMLRSQTEGILSPEQIQKVAYANAARLYRHPEPPNDLLARSLVVAGAVSNA